MNFNINDIGALRVAGKMGVGRFTANAKGQLINSRQSLGGRLVQWMRGLSKGTHQGSAVHEGNQEAISKFQNSIKAIYGPAVADRISDDLRARHTACKPLSSSTIRSSLKRLDAGAKAFREVNRSFYQNSMKSGSVHQHLKEFVGREPSDVFSKSELKELKFRVAQEFSRHPDVSKRQLGGKDFKAILERSASAIIERKGQGIPARGLVSSPRMHSSAVDRGIKNLETFAQSLKGEASLVNAGALKDASKGTSLSTDLPLEVAADAAKSIVNARIELANTSDLLEKTPLDGNDYHNWVRAVSGRSRNIMELEAHIDSLRQSHGDAIEKTCGKDSKAALDAAALELKSASEDIENAIVYSHSFLDEEPLRGNKVIEAQKVWLDSARSILDKIETDRPDSRTQGNEDWQTVLSEARRSLQAHEDGLGSLRLEHQRLSPDRARKLERDSAALATRVVRNVERAVAYNDTRETGGIKDKDLRVRLREARIEVLEKQQKWTPLRSIIQFKFGDHSQRFDNETLMGRHIGNKDDGLAKSYVEDGMEAAQSHDYKQAKHATSLGTTKVSDPKTGKPIFQGVRHGVHSALKISNPALRRSANRTRAQESVKAALRANPAVLKAALAGADEEGKAVDLPIVSVSLLTPVNLPGRRNELKMLKDQTEAWQGINGKPLKVEVFDENKGKSVSVFVKPKVMPLNLGVNLGAIHLKMGWDLTNELNAGSLGALVGSFDRRDAPGGLAGDFLKRENVSDEDALAIRELTDQVRDIYNKGDYKKDGGDIYKLQSRLLVLAGKVGATPMWNCKSGKDRTGHLDAEAKALATEIHLRGGSVPRPGPLSTERQGVLRAFALRGGSREVQRFNTGYAGYKTYGMASNVQRIGGKENLEFARLYEGAASIVKN